MGSIAKGVIHQGQVVAKYRKAKDWSQSDLAEVLKVDLRTVQRMEQQSIIKNLDRREFLVGMLDIPLALMGLENERQLAEKVQRVPRYDRIAFFEQEMEARRTLYHTGGTICAAHGLDTWIRELAEFIEFSQGSGWFRRGLVLLTLSYQLQICVSRDLLNFAQAQEAGHKAHQIAQELNDPELLAAAMAHQGIALLQQEQPSEAIRYLNGGLETIRYAGLPGVRSYILQALSEAYAKTQQARESWQSTHLAERALEQREQTPDSSKTQLFASSIMAQKGVNAVLLHDYERAEALINKALMQYNPTFIRGKARLLAQKAEACYGLGMVEESATIAEEALRLARSVGSRKTTARIQSLYSIFQESRWRKECSVARLGALLAR